jgi:hypothetical protein
MKLERLYKYSIFQREYLIKCYSLENTEYVSNITLYFNGDAYIKIYIDDICIEKALARNVYYVKNFRDCAFPTCIYNLRIECDIEYSMIVSSHEHDEFIRSSIILHGVYYEFYPDTCKYNYINMRNGKYLMSNEVKKLQQQTYKSSNEDIVISIKYDPNISSNTALKNIRKNIIPSYGVPYHLLLINNNKESIYDNYVILPKTQLCRFTDEIKKILPDVVLEISSMQPSELLDLNRKNIKQLINLLNNKHKSNNIQFINEFYDITDIDEIY